MRTLTAPMLASVAKTITDPIFLIKIDFDTEFVYATSREAVSYPSSAVDLSVDAASDEIRDAANGFVNDGFAVGDTIVTTNFVTGANNATWTILTVTAGVITVSETGILVDAVAEAANIDGNNYNNLGAEILSIDGTTVKFSLPNFDRAISALALGNQVRGNDVVVYLHYDGETIGRFIGLLDVPEISGDYNTVVFSCVSEYAMGAKWPSERLRPPVANHLPPPGTVIHLGPITITLERDRN